MKKIILTIIMGMFLITLVGAVEQTNFTGGEMGSFNTVIIQLLMSFTIFIPIIIVYAILGLFMRGGSYYVNPWVVIIIGSVAILISIFLGPVIIESITGEIFN